MKKYFKIQWLIFLATVLQGCAYIITGNTKKVKFNSNPPGAVVYHNGEKICETPCDHSFKETTLIGSNYTREYIFKKEGYEDATVILRYNFNPFVIMNVCMPLGFPIDFFTGSHLKLQKDEFNVELIKKK
ncbi:MAG: PEGA domain-containing protein [Bacteroidia bacterium]|nr:PEGA domain-containing protein [Bacteroidia bacterium]